MPVILALDHSAPGGKKVENHCLKSLVYIHLLSVRGASGVREHRNALSQCVSTALRCLGLKITFMFKLTRQNTFLRKQRWPDRKYSLGG